PTSGKVEGIYTEPQLNHVRMLYAELVTLCDKQLGRLMDAMRRLGLEENTLLMMVSDHGEPMGNGEHGHGLMRKTRPWPYEELAHTPMLVRFPGIKAGQRIKAYVQSCDVAPTVCDWLGIGVHPAMQGKSLLPVLRGETDTVHEFSIAGYYSYSWSIYTDDWSYIHWMQDNDVQNMAGDFYAKHIDNSHLKAVGGKTLFQEKIEGINESKAWKDDALSGNAAAEHYKAMASMDGADQWTCTPQSTTEVPETDELYDRRNDPFQLNNVIADHPDVAKMLFMKLSDYITELQNS
ncbi:MAG: sulfatase-like hydrolase/transferase, partial [Mailhella sp.]|nr:sulfatase-like hydrolase/transferase [Mailhella sp.]